MKRLLVALLLASLVLSSTSCLFFLPKFLPIPPPTSESAPKATVEAPAIVLPDPNWRLPAPPGPAAKLDNIEDVVAKVKATVVGLEGSRGWGSGWIIDKRGIIVTCAHVVKDEAVMLVTLADGRSFRVESRHIYLAPDDDLAVIKLDAVNLEQAYLGDFTKLREGAKIVAIGNAKGEGLTIRDGAINRLNVPWAVRYIEISALITGGMSGGPVFDMTAQVVGIVLGLRVERYGGVIVPVAGMNYAISIRSALPVIEQLIRTGSAP